MTIYKTVEIQWLDDPNRSLSALVGVGEWSEEINDERVFYYFANQEEYELAKQPSGIDDFRIIDEEDN